MKPSEVAELQTDLLSFVLHMFEVVHGCPMVYNWHLRVICNALERVMLGKTKNLIINIPPRASKTEIAVVNFIPWAMGIFPDSEFIHATYSHRLAAFNASKAKGIIEHPEYKKIFPDVELSKDCNAKDEFKTTSGGIVYATGAGGSITGYGAGKKRPLFGGAIVIDDPHKAGEALSEVMRNNVIDWYQTTMESRKNTPDTPVIVIMQRLHEDDLAGWLLKGSNGDEWEHICIPAINESGTSFWEEYFPLEDLERKKKANKYVYAGQYSQSPSVLGGNMFKAQHWKYYTSLPKIRKRVIYADTAMKDKEQNDFSVFQCWGLSWTGQIYLIDQVRGKYEAPELLIVGRSFWRKHKAVRKLGRIPAFKVEDKASGTGLIQTLKREGIPIVGIERSTDKVSRAMDAIPAIESGNVFLPENASWLSDYLYEFEQFPSGTFDDQVDPTMDAISDLIGINVLDYSKL